MISAPSTTGMMNNDIAITVFGFETRYSNVSGELKGRDWIEFAPRGDKFTKRWHPVDMLSAVQSEEEAGGNIAALVARRTWDAVRPLYEHWKVNNELPTIGTPLATWSGLGPQEASILKQGGIKTIEELAEASDIILTKIGLPRFEIYRTMAKKFLDGAKSTADAGKVAELEAANKSLAEEVEEMKKVMLEMLAERDAKKPKRADRAQPVEAAA